MSDHPALKTVATYATPVEADLARNRLGAGGIRSFIGDDSVVGWAWHLGLALGGVKVLVAESDLADAREILAQRKSSSSSQSWVCEKCGAEVAGNMDACWRCGTSSDGVEDPDFIPVARTVAAQEVSANEEDLPSSWQMLFAGIVMPVASLVLVLILAHHTRLQANYLLPLFMLSGVPFLFALFQSHRKDLPSASHEILTDPPEGAADEVAVRAAPGGREKAHRLVLRASLAAVFGIACTGAGISPLYDAFCSILPSPCIVFGVPLSLYSLWLIYRRQLFARAPAKSQLLLRTAFFLNWMHLGILLAVVVFLLFFQR